MTITVRDRFRGALLGLAAGDALGTTLEFRPRGSFAPISDMVGGGPFDLAPGQWTDDTSMALCLAESLVERRGFDPVDQIERYLAWYRRGHWSSRGECFDIGTTVRDALERFESNPARGPFAGSEDPFSAGNGSWMRLAPVVLHRFLDPAAAIADAAASSRTTHGAPAAVDACQYFAGLLLGALNGASREELLRPHYAPATLSWDDEPLMPVIRRIAGGSFYAKDEGEIQASGYVVHTLEAALWAFARADDFRDGCLLAVNLGDDADTTGAVYGQLAGAFYGVGGIPPEWLAKLARADEIELLADRLFELSEAEG